MLVNVAFLLVTVAFLDTNESNHPGKCVQSYQSPSIYLTRTRLIQDLYLNCIGSVQQLNSIYSLSCQGAKALMKLTAMSRS